MKYSNNINLIQIELGKANLSDEEIIDLNQQRNEAYYEL